MYHVLLKHSLLGAFELRSIYSRHRGWSYYVAVNSIFRMSIEISEVHWYSLSGFQKYKLLYTIFSIIEKCPQVVKR